jgi:hypothetical protein
MNKIPAFGKSFHAVTLFILLTLPTISVGAPILWTLNDVTFYPSGSAAGYFTIDDNGTVTDFSLSTQYLNNTLFPMSNYLFDGSNSVGSVFGNNVKIVSNFTYLDYNNLEWDITRSLSLVFNGSLNEMSSNLMFVEEKLIQTNWSLDYSGGPYRQSISGSATPTVATVPEPSISALFILGLGLLGLVSRRNKLV